MIASGYALTQASSWPVQLWSTDPESSPAAAVLVLFALSLCAGFKVHPYYEDFSSPCFAGLHNMVSWQLGIDWLACGVSACACLLRLVNCPLETGQLPPKPTVPPLPLLCLLLLRLCRLLAAASSARGSWPPSTHAISSGPTSSNTPASASCRVSQTHPCTTLRQPPQSSPYCPSLRPAVWTLQSPMWVRSRAAAPCAAATGERQSQTV